MPPESDFVSAVAILCGALAASSGCVHADGDSGRNDDSTSSIDSSPDSETVEDTNVAVVDADQPLQLLPMPGQNVVLLQVDTLRADHFGAYGYSRVTTPQLDALPWLAVTGERSTAPWTLPSTASQMTGLSPQHHELLFFYTGHAANGPLHGVTFQERLQDKGYQTGLFSGNDVVSDYNGVAIGFDTNVQLIKGTAGGGPNGGGSLAALGGEALTWIDSLPPGKPFYIHLQPMNMHQTLVVPDEDLALFSSPSFAIPKNPVGGYDDDDFLTAYLDAANSTERENVHQSVIDLYDGAMYGLDREAAEFIAGLDSRGLLANTTIVLTADHGETLDDERDMYWNHGGTLREELTRIPLLILQPGGAASAQTCVSSNVDLWPTLWGAMGYEALEGLDGVDLANGCRTEAQTNRFESDGVTDASAGNEVGKVSVNCAQGLALGTNRGEGADVAEATPASGVNGGAGLSVAVANQLGEIKLLLGGADCQFE